MIKLKSIKRHVNVYNCVFFTKAYDALEDICCAQGFVKIFQDLENKVIVKQADDFKL